MPSFKIPSDTPSLTAPESVNPSVNPVRFPNITPHQVWQAAHRIQPYIRNTPLLYSKSLSKLANSSAGSTSSRSAPSQSTASQSTASRSVQTCNFYLKLENLQDIGAFKVRGAANAILSLSEAERAKGVATFSTGNHGLAVAYVAQRLGIPAVVCISNDVPQRKVNAIKSTGAEIRVVGHSQDEAESYCYELEKSEGFAVIKPFDDANVIAGQGTIGLELLKEVPNLDTVIIPLSGGGLIAGVSLALKSNHPQVRIIGVSMEQGAAMYESIQAGKPIAIEEMPTMADSLRGGIGLENEYTFAMVQSLVDEIVLVSEEAIADGMRFMFQEHGMVVEGAAATGIGAVVHQLIPNLAGNVAILITGRNVDDSVVFDLLQSSQS